MVNKKCLIVDDEHLLLTFLCGCLDNQGYECSTATSAEQALEILLESSFAFMITDIQMAEMTGIKLTHEAKQLYPAMPVIIMTGFTDEYSYDEVIEAGADDFLKKPFSMKELDTRIARVTRDVLHASMAQKKGRDLEEVSNLMISGVQEEAMEKIVGLEEELSQLKKQGTL